MSSTTSAPSQHCRNCRHYYITHDASFPYGCRAMNFKSKNLPLQDVRASTGKPCLTFDAKAVIIRRKPARWIV